MPEALAVQPCVYVCVVRLLIELQPLIRADIDCGCAEWLPLGTINNGTLLFPQ